MAMTTTYEIERLPAAVCLAIEYGDKEMFEALWNQERSPEEWKAIADQAIQWLYSTIKSHEELQCIPGEQCLRLKRTSAIQEFEQLIELSLDAESYGDDGPRTLALEVDRKRQLRITERQRKGDPLRDEYFAWAVNKELTTQQAFLDYMVAEIADNWLRKERRTTFVKARPEDLSAYLDSERERLLNHSEDGSLGVPQEALIESCEELLEHSRVSMHNVYDFLEEKGLVGKNPMDGLVGEDE